MLVDGVVTTADWPLDRALQYGDGLFETLSVRNGRLRFEAPHRRRLSEGCRRLSIVVDADEVWHQARLLASTHGECTVKILVSRGGSPTRGYTPPRAIRARVLHYVYPGPSAGEIPAAVRLVTLQSVLGENPALAGLKHCNRLEQVLGRMELQPTGAFEGLMTSSSGDLISGTMSNVFIVRDGELVTPLLDRCGIAGVMRAVVLREASGCGLAAREARLPLAALRQCTAAFVTNARMGVVVAQEIDGRVLPPDPTILRLANTVNALAD
jgi:4-amino-4-deoxychorismate lyase